jgi:hypothetical protein
MMNTKDNNKTASAAPESPRWIDMQDMTRDQLIDYAVGLLDQRDELLAAAKQAQAYIAGANTCGAQQRHAYSLLFSAIAKCEK